MGKDVQQQAMPSWYCGDPTEGYLGQMGIQCREGRGRCCCGCAAVGVAAGRSARGGGLEDDPAMREELGSLTCGRRCTGKMVMTIPARAEEMHGDSTGHTGCALLDAAGCWQLDFVLEAAVS